MDSLKIIIYGLILCCVSCGSVKNIIIKIENPLNIDRTLETIELSKSFLKVNNLDNLGVKDQETGEIVVSQLVDKDNDGVNDIILFQTKLEAKLAKKYIIVKLPDKRITEEINYCYSRFIPEREDDYAWENNRVAFRVYGPKGQELAESNTGSGILSSGIDIWLKRVEYPIINKWYKKTLDGVGSYHQDTGEGLDNFTVGASRGVGGTAVQINKEYYFSKNFTNFKTITVGPIRTSFVLEFNSWKANGSLITETKRISLDYGSNLTKYQINIIGSKNLSSGLAIHTKDYSISTDKNLGWLSNWEKHGDSMLGTAIVSAPNTFVNIAIVNNTENTDLNNAYMSHKLINNIGIYYAGFGWEKSGQFKNELEWINYINKYSKQINAPLVVTIY
ncbi:DUF4861 family protein [Flavobacteriaceae bacterium KMM 6898]|nr:DUF4861 family protein [Flavobacteriaceae bacterium KMM 6898]